MNFAFFSRIEPNPFSAEFLRPLATGPHQLPFLALELVHDVRTQRADTDHQDALHEGPSLHGFCCAAWGMTTRSKVQIWLMRHSLVSRLPRVKESRKGCPAPWRSCMAKRDSRVASRSRAGGHGPGVLVRSAK